MKTKTFCMVNNYYPPYHLGGAAIHVYHLANALADLGHKVHIIYSLDWYFLKRKGVPKEEYPNHKNITLHPISSPIKTVTPLIAFTFGHYFPISKKIIQIIENIKPDIIHYHNITGFGPFILKANARKKIYTAHDYWLICPIYTLLKKDNSNCINYSNFKCFFCSISSKKPPQFWRYFNLNNFFLENIDYLISPSEFLQNVLLREGINNIITIPNFVVPSKTQKKSTLNYKYLLFVGRLELNKGIMNLIETFIAQNKSDIHLVIVGDGSLRKEIEKYSKNRNLHYLGKVDEKTLSNLYQFALATIIPSIWNENCPIVALESLSNGTPIIGTEFGGLPEIIKKSNAGIIVPFNEIKSLYNKIEQKENLLKKLKINAYPAFKKYYSKDIYLEKYFELLNNI